MIISCPNCFARYTLPQGAMPAEGRKVRCSSCSNIWLAKPGDDETSAADEAPAAVQETADETVSADTTDKLAAIRAAMEEEAAHLVGGEAEEVVSDQEKLDIEEEAANFDADSMDFDVEDATEETADDTVMTGGVSDPDEINERFADDEFSNDPIEAEFDYEENIEAIDYSDDDFEDDLITRRRRHQREEAEYRSAERRSQMAAVGWVFLILFLGTIVGLFYMVPDKIVSWWPAADKVYTSMGVSSEGQQWEADRRETPKVDIRPYPAETIPDGENYKLTLSGKIVNNGLRSVTVPAVTFVLLNNQEEEILKGSFCLPSRILRKSQSVEYEHSINPAPLETANARVDIIWEWDSQGKMIDSCSSAAATQ